MRIMFQEVRRVQVIKEILNTPIQQILSAFYVPTTICGGDAAAQKLI